MSYVIGVSSGAFTVTGAEEKIQLAGLFKKAQSAITKGVNFIQLDLESLAEFKEPDLVNNIKMIERMNVSFGVHSETAAFGIEMSEPDSAIEIDYRMCHNRLWDVLESSGKINAKYVLIHSSESVPFALLGRHLQPAILVDVWGRNLKDFIEKENMWIMDWLLPKEGILDPDTDEKTEVRGKGTFVWTDILGRELSVRLKEVFVDYEESTEYHYLQENKKMTPEEIIKKRKDRIRKELEMTFLSFVESRSHHYGPERYAYIVIAKWMEKNDDPLWKNIIESNIDFLAKYENKPREKWIEDIGIKQVDGKWSLDDPKFRDEYRLWVPAVSAKYIWGHFNQDKCPDGNAPFKDKDLKKVLKVKYNGTEYVMPLVLESPMAHRGTEEWLRLPNPLQMYYLAKEINESAGFDAIVLAFDLEHMISIRVDPESVVQLLPEDGGKLVRVIHAGWPAPLAPAHLPIQLGSEQQFYLYRVYYKLKQKGFGKDAAINNFIIFERGGPETFQESILSLRKIVDFLNKDIPPEKLVEHPEFFGVSTGDVASYERQVETIKAHARDPLQGLLAVPEEAYTFLGRAATGKPGISPEKWKKEELQ